MIILNSQQIVKQHVVSIFHLKLTLNNFIIYNYTVYLIFSFFCLKISPYNVISKIQNYLFFDDLLYIPMCKQLYRRKHFMMNLIS